MASKLSLSIPSYLAVLLDHFERHVVVVHLRGNASVPQQTTEDEEENNIMGLTGTR